jgi:hypothetical protein
MMGGRTPKTCWAVNKRQDNKLKNCCIWLVIYLNCTMMHGLTNLKRSRFRRGPGSYRASSQNASVSWNRGTMYGTQSGGKHNELSTEFPSWPYRQK